MFRETAFAVAAAVVATAALSASVTTASAGERHHGHGQQVLVAGAVLGLVGALAGASQERRRDADWQDAGYRGECFDKPIMRWDPYYDERVIVGYRTVCR